MATKTETKKPINNKGNSGIADSELDTVLSTPEAQAKINDIVAKAVAEALKLAQQPQIVQVNTAEEMVTLQSMEAGHQGTMVSLGENIGEIACNGGTLDVPKKVFLQRCSMPVVSNRLKDGRLLVISGLNDNELRRIGALHNPEQLLNSDVFLTLLDWDMEQAFATFERACPTHKRIMATLYTDAYIMHDNRVSQALVQKLNELSKSVDKEGMFTAILKDMAKQLADG